MLPTSKPIGIVNTSKNAIVGSGIRVAAATWFEAAQAVQKSNQEAPSA